MNYEKNYYAYIAYVQTLGRRRVRKTLRDGSQNPDYIQYEEHHIVPRAFGGPDEKDNLVLLTPREHFLAHYLLCKIYASGPNHYKMVYALNRMRTTHRMSSRLYETYREEWLGLVSRKHTGKFVSEETRKKIGEKSRCRSAESNEIISQKNMAYQKDPKTLAKRKESYAKKSEAWKAKSVEERSIINAKRRESCLKSLQDPEVLRKIQAGSIASAKATRHKVIQSLLATVPGVQFFLVMKDGVVEQCRRDDFLRLVCEEDWQYVLPKFQFARIRISPTKNKQVPLEDVFGYLQQGYELSTKLFSKPLPRPWED